MNNKSSRMAGYHIDLETLEKFRKYAKKRGLTMSRLITNFVEAIVGLDSFDITDFSKNLKAEKNDAEKIQRCRAEISKQGFLAGNLATWNGFLLEKCANNQAKINLILTALKNKELK